MTSIDYIQKRTFKRITVMIIFVWIISAIVCVCPLFGWKDPDWEKRIQDYQLCLISQDVGYQVIVLRSSVFVVQSSKHCIDLVSDATHLVRSFYT